MEEEEEAVDDADDTDLLTLSFSKSCVGAIGAFWTTSGTPGRSGTTKDRAANPKQKTYVFCF